VKKLHVGASTLTNTIFAGSFLKCGRVWAANKQDATIDAILAVAQHVAQFGNPVEIRNAGTGKIEYRITVEEVKETS